jgi:membrane-bound metal-dependent hydrolase YbcI (DUF457 family)
MGISVWLVLFLVAFGLTISLGSEWLVARWHRAQSLRLSPRRAAGHLVWVLIIVGGGLLAARYIERMLSTPAGWLIFGALAVVLSLIQALLRQQADQDQFESRQGPPNEQSATGALGQVAYPLFAVVVYLGLSGILSQRADPILFLPLSIGALLPDLDRPSSWLGRLLPFLSRRLQARFGECGPWHSLAAAVAVGVISLPLLLVVDVRVWAMIPLGFLSHLALDLFHDPGILLLWPVSDRRYLLWSPARDRAGAQYERRVVLGLVAAVVILLLLVELGPPQPAPIPRPSYEEVLRSYYDMRGRNQVFARVDGTWQASGRRINESFEILNGVGDSLVLLDRYTGQVFQAGREATDHLHLNRIDIQVGPPVSIKDVEIHLEAETLAEIVPLLYEMQSEPGIQHIYVSGDVVLPAAGEAAPLSVDYAQTSIRKIQSLGAGHYRLRYLTASDLIGLANVQVGEADLVIVATYASVTSEPTVTPLPPIPAVPDGADG